MVNKIILLDVFSGFKKTQDFGLTEFAKNNPQYYKAYGNRHPGIDYTYRTKSNLLIRAAHSGIIVRDDDIDDNGAGINVSIFNPEQMIATRYYHLKYNDVEINDRISAGDVIGLMGTTGASTGIHLHFGLFRTNRSAVIIGKDNGMRGAIDPYDKYIAYWQRRD